MSNGSLLIENLSKSYGDVCVFTGLNLHVNSGETLALLGPSGCGKTTLLHMISGLSKAENGRILMDGREISAPGPHAGMVFQSPALFEWLTVQENIEFGLRMGGMSRAERHALSKKYIDRVGLPDFANSYPSELSGGMSQRAALARVLILSPQVILWDEPFAALEAKLRREMQALLLTLRTEQESTIVFVTRDIEEALVLADRIIVFSPRPAQVAGEVLSVFQRGKAIDMVDSYEFSDQKAMLRDMLADVGR